MNGCSMFVLDFAWSRLGTSWMPPYSPIHWIFFHWQTLEGRRWSLTEKICLMTGMVKIIGKIWPGRIVLGPREVWVISPTRIVRLRVWIVLQLWVGHIHVFRRYLISLKNRTLFENWFGTWQYEQPRLWIGGGLIWLTFAGSFVSRASILLIRFPILASIAMDDSKDRIPPFEALDCEFLDFSKVGSHCRVFSARSLNKSTP